MPGKSKQQLLAMYAKLVEHSNAYRVAPPANEPEIYKWIDRGDQTARDRAEQEMVSWAKNVQAAKQNLDQPERSIPPTPVEIQANADSRDAQARRPRLAEKVDLATMTPKAATTTTAAPRAATTTTTRAAPRVATPTTAAPKAATTTATPPRLPPNVVGFGDKIVDFAVKAVNDGQQIGNGECWTLANEAMKAAGASAPEWRYKLQGGTLNFGTLITEVTPDKTDEITKAKPGDILQCYNTRVVEQSGRKLMAVQHTAIVEKVVGTSVTIIECGRGIRPRRDQMEVGRLVAGTLKVWRAVAPPPGEEALWNVQYG
jgi:hypothetical protein